MSNLIEQIIDYMDQDIYQLREEYESGDYAALERCPSYRIVKCYCDAIKALNRMDGRYDVYTTPRGCLRQNGLRN